LLDGLQKHLLETAGKADLASSEFEQKTGEMLQQIAVSGLEKSFNSQEEFHHRWQMVNDMDTLSSQADVATMSRKDFKQKVVEMVTEKWLPRNKDYVTEGLLKLQREMSSQYESHVAGVLEELRSSRRAVDTSLQIVEELQNAYA